MLADGIVSDSGTSFNLLSNNKLVYLNNYELYTFDLITKDVVLLNANADDLHETDNYIYMYNGNRYLQKYDKAKVLTVYDKNFNKIDELVNENVFLLTQGTINDKLHICKHTITGTNRVELKIWEYYLEDSKLKKREFFYYDNTAKFGGYSFKFRT